MASKPGFLTEWPWAPLGNFKYLLLAPFAAHSTYLLFGGSSSILSHRNTADLGYFLIAPMLISRIIHNQIWISYSRYRTAKGKNLIVDKSIDFDQVDRERNWDDQIILTGILFYVFYWILDSGTNIPFWKTDGVIQTALIHTGPVEFIYYWLHRALHHHFLYSRYHSHHHSSIVTEPITSVIHPFAEHVAYFILFSIPLAWTVVNHTASITSLFLYITYIDFMNNMGHCNFEHIPKWVFSAFPPLKYLMYTPSYHSLHHTQFRTNYCLFMPFYDYVYGTMDKSSDSVYEKSLSRPDERPDVVYLTHLTTLQSLYQIRIGFASLASDPLCSKWYLWLMWPVTLWSMVVTWIYGRTFVLDRNIMDKLKIQSWAIPRYNIHYSFKWQKVAISNMIEEAILDAERKNVKVLSLGLLNQGEDLNGNGEVYIQKYPKLKLKLVDGSSLAVAVILNSIPEGTAEVILRGNLSKVAYSVAYALCQKGVQVTTLRAQEYEQLKIELTPKYRRSLVLAKTSSHKIWLVGDDFGKDDQSRASKGSLFIPFSPLPPKKTRKDCFYHNTPAMLTPTSLANQHACENWLPRRAISAWRLAGILHALEEWNVHECGKTMFCIDKIWQAALHHGFRPLPVTSSLHK